MKALILVASAFGVLLIGCSGSQPRQAFVQSAAAPVKKIALLQIEDIKYLGVISRCGALSEERSDTVGWGEIASGVPSKSLEFTQLVNDQKLMLTQHMSDEMAQLLQSGLSKQGFDVVYLADQRPQTTADHKAEYSQIHTDADAILDVGFITVGYMCPSQSLYANYKPWVQFVARLVSARDKTTRLYFQVFSYGTDFSNGTQEGIEFLPADPQYEYQNFDRLKAQVTQAAEGIKQSVRPIAMRLVEQLR